MSILLPRHFEIKKLKLLWVSIFIAYVKMYVLGCIMFDSNFDVDISNI